MNESGSDSTSDKGEKSDSSGSGSGSERYVDTMMPLCCFLVVVFYITYFHSTAIVHPALLDRDLKGLVLRNQWTDPIIVMTQNHHLNTVMPTLQNLTTILTKILQMTTPLLNQKDEIVMGN